MNYFKNKIIWVTGASSGIGEGFVRHLSKWHCHLIISARRITELERVKRENMAQATVEILVLDLADATSLEAKTREAEDFFGHVDVIIHCGGISQRDKIINTAMAVQRQIMEVNYFGTIALSKYLMGKMIERQTGHHVVVTSAVGIISTPLRAGYAASKHAIHGFYDALRAEHFNDHIKVTLICPGYVKTNISINALMGNGVKQNTMDDAQANGITVNQLVVKSLLAIAKGEEESYFGGWKEVVGIYIKRFVPLLFSKIIRKN